MDDQPEPELKQELLIQQVTGHLVVGEMAKQRICGFFDSKQDMQKFVADAPFKIIAIKKLTVTYRDGEGLNYATSIRS